MNSMNKNNWSNLLVKYFKLNIEIEPQLFKACYECLNSKGGYIRARLINDVGQSFQINVDIIEKIAVSIEYYHLASLIIDDLPCMDNANFRRGKLCIHKTYGESTAILLSLALVNMAYALIWDAMAKLEIDKRNDIRELIQNCLGLDGMINGQAKDLAYRQNEYSIESFTSIAIDKTASLIKLSLLIPAIIKGISNYERYHLQNLSTYWGLNYQILDDLSDYISDQEQTVVNTDINNSEERPNIVLTVGYEKSIDEMERLKILTESAIASLVKTRKRWESLDRFQNELNAKAASIIQASKVA